MKAVDEGDDLVGALPMELPPPPRQFDGALIRLGTGTGKEDVVETAVPHQHLGQIQRLLVVERGAGVDEGLRLDRQCLRHRSRCVAQAVDCPALHPIEIAPALAVVKPGTFATDEDNVRARSNRHQIVVGGGHGLSPEREKNKKATGLPWPLGESCAEADR